MIEMSLGLEVALVLGAAGMGILALPWSATELSESWRAVGEAARRVVGARPVSAVSLVPGASELTGVPAPVRMKASA